MVTSARPMTASLRRSAIWGLGLWLLLSSAQVSGSAAYASEAGAENGERVITGLGRLEPKDGVIRVAGPSRPAVVIAKLLIEEGDRVKEGQPIAVLDSYEVHKAELARLRAEFENAEREFKRISKLCQDGVASDSARDDAEMNVKVARAKLGGAQAEFDRSIVRSPLDGQVLEIHARTGERVGPKGIAELGRTDDMYAIAEIYETDIAKVFLGQRAQVHSPAFPAPIGGVVERIGRKVGKMDVLSTDPAAKTDARVIEVEIRLDGESDVANLTNLQVEVEILP
jgi:HlyD family secretion protein